MWKLIFDNVTKRGTGCHRDPQDGEFSVDQDKSLCAFFDVTPGRYKYVGGVFSEVSTWATEQGIKAIEETRIKNEQAIRDTGSAQLLALGNPYSAEERETWITQEAEARAWTANHNAVCPMITAMAATRGIPLATMVQKIIENANLFKGASGQILGAQQKALDLLGV